MTCLSSGLGQFQAQRGTVDTAKTLSAKARRPLISNLHMLEHFISGKENRAQVLEASVQHV